MHYTLVVVRSRLIPCEIFRGQSGAGIGFTPALRFSRVGNIPLMLYSCLHLHICSYRMGKRAKPGNLKKGNGLLETGGHWIEKYSDLVISWLSPVLKLMLRWLPSCCCMHFIQSSGFNFIKIKLIALTLRRLMSYIYIYGALILDVSRSHTTTQHSR